MRRKTAILSFAVMSRVVLVGLGYHVFYYLVNEEEEEEEEEAIEEDQAVVCSPGHET